MTYPLTKVIPLGVPGLRIHPVFTFQILILHVTQPYSYSNVISLPKLCKLHIARLSCSWVKGG